jgi:hypothetical protein
MSNRENLVEKLRRLGPEHVVDNMELCPACDALSPGIAMDGETIMRCPVCQDKGMVTLEKAERWRQAMHERHGIK